MIQRLTTRTLPFLPITLSIMILETEVSICIHLNMSKVKIIASSTDSDLEAFSHYPTNGSFAALAFQLTANTNY
jgi:hypothetical protein